MDSSAKGAPMAATDKPLRVVIERRWYDWIKPIAGVLFVLLLVWLAMQPSDMFGKPAAKTETTFDEWFVTRDPVPAGDKKTALIGLVDLEGEIVSQDVADNEMPDQAVITPQDVRDALADFSPDDGFKAVVLHITTPGGMVTSSDEIARIVAEYQKDVLPVYVYADDLLASGGYYVASAAKKIYAHKLATVGSIGVIYEVPNVVGLKEKLGVDMETYTTGPYKDTNSPYRNRTPDEKKMIAADLQENLDAFMGQVETGRKLGADAVKKLATGQVWSGQKAMDLKLVDDVVYADELAGDLADDLGIPDDQEIAYIRYDAPKSLVDQVLNTIGAKTGRSPEKALSEMLQPLRAGSYYLYRR